MGKYAWTGFSDEPAAKTDTSQNGTEAHTDVRTNASNSDNKKAKYKMICPKCGTVYDGGTKESLPCVKCGAGVVYSGFLSKEFNALSPEEQRKIINNFKSVDVRSKITHKGRSFWISFVDTILDIFIVLGILASITGGVILIAEDVGDIGWLLGLLAMVLGIILTLLSVALMKIIIGAASDLNYIKRYLESR